MFSSQIYCFSFYFLGRLRPQTNISVGAGLLTGKTNSVRNMLYSLRTNSSTWVVIVHQSFSSSKEFRMLTFRALALRQSESATVKRKEIRVLTFRAFVLRLS